jgi:hypothetical protein
MPMKIKKVTTYSEYRAEIVEPDFNDFIKDDGDLRAAFHCAISLFHLHDWVYQTHKLYIDANFAFKNKLGLATPVSNHAGFADALADQYPDFELIRGVANSAKHLSLRPRKVNRPAPPSNMPSNAANTFAQSAGWDNAQFDQDKWNGAPTVKLEGDNNQHLVLSEVATKVRDMWDALFVAHGW